MQQRLGVAAGLLFAFEDAIASRLVGCAARVISHVFVEQIAFVLTVYHFGHVLAADAQGVAVSLALKPNSFLYFTHGEF
jgi:hypothetical protein